MKILKKTAAFLCAAIITASALPLSSNAERSDELICPSGNTWSEVKERLDTSITNWTDNSDMYEDKDSGFSQLGNTAEGVAVFRGDEVLWSGCSGYTDIENKVLADEDTVYEWGSITKTFVWVSAMQLYEQGKLDLDEDIRTYLPDDFFKYLKYDDPITMTDLMNHTGGWCENNYPLEIKNESDILPLGEALQKTEPAQTYRPGEVISYSNWGAALAGYIVERVSGMDFTDYVHENILEPLGMEHTAIAIDHTDNEWVLSQRRKVKSYARDENQLDYLTGLGVAMYYVYIYPCGSAVGTISDLTTYAQAFVDDSHPLFEKAETQEKLFSGSAFYGNSDVPYVSYGFFANEYTDVRTYGHDGATVAGTADMQFDPETGFGVVMATNEQYEVPLWVNIMIFGSLGVDKYPVTSTECLKLDGYYTSSRVQAAGLWKYLMYLDAFTGSMIDNIFPVSDGLYLMYDPENPRWGATVVGEVTESDGTKGYVIGGNEYRQIHGYVPMLCLLTSLLLCGVISIFVLLAKRKIRRAGKAQPLTGSALMTAGQFAKIVSVLAIFTSTLWVHIFANKSTLTSEKTFGTVIGITQLICMAVCAAAGIAAIYGLIAKKNGLTGRLRYIFSIAGNCLAFAAIFFFDMYRFWIN